MRSWKPIVNAIAKYNKRATPSIDDCTNTTILHRTNAPPYVVTIVVYVHLHLLFEATWPASTQGHRIDRRPIKNV